jgi:2-(1,2-epoxy-1,2-dihydrophenyl)acetyl-CoA isomerase
MSGTDAPVLTGFDGDVMVVTMNRPEVLNALDDTLLRGLKLAWERAAQPDVRAVVVTGAGRGFCAGADFRLGDAQPELGGLEHGSNPHMLALAALRKAVVCAVNGPAVGAGLSLACAGDIRIASPAAFFVAGFGRIGLCPDAGASFLVPRHIGYARAFDFLCSDQRVGAQLALEWGLVNEVVPTDQLLDRALERAHAFAAMPGRAVELTKRLLDRAHHGSLPDLLDEEARAMPLAVEHPERARAWAAMSQKVVGAAPRPAADS